MPRQETAGVLFIDRPAGAPAPAVFDSPHSGSTYPGDFDSIQPASVLRRAEDTYVDELYAAAPDLGATLIGALFPRCYIDANRAEDDLDPALLAEPWPHPLQPTAKADAGIGLIWRRYSPDFDLYDRKLGIAEVQRRIETYHRPYHAAVKAALDGAHARFARVYHVNCHSMPSISNESSPEGPGVARPDFNLGDRDGSTADPVFTEMVRGVLAGLGYQVTVNWPYKGVELVRAYGDPAVQRHSLQIEVSRGLYMNEDTFEKSAGFAGLQSAITSLVQAITSYTREPGG